jgi:lipid II:glycine glycyltransferase (peptidoglycan interpeptide bridge formation enzyme)
MQAELLTIIQFSELISKLKIELPLFSQMKWLQLFDKRLRILSITNDDKQMIGFLYGLEGKKMRFNYFINTPFTPHCGLVYKTNSSNVSNTNTYNKKIIKVVADYMTEKNISLIQFAMPHSIVDMQPFIWKNYLVKTKYTYRLALANSEEYLFNNLSSEKRKSIRKAELDQIKIERVTNINSIAGILKNTLIKNNVKFDPKLFEKILLEFASHDNCIAFAAYNTNNILIAATFCLHDANTCYYLFGGIDEQNKHHGAGVKCMWASILLAKQLKIHTFDFEGSMLIDVEKYFREFGGTLTPYYEVKYQTKLLKLIN